jgi:hypothetical protein
MLELNSNQLAQLGSSYEDQQSLTMGVYKMKIAHIANKDKNGDLLLDKNGENYILIAIDTKFKTKSGAKRYFKQGPFYLTGTDKFDLPKIRHLKKLFTDCFSFEPKTVDDILSVIGKEIVVTTKKDSGGFIVFHEAYPVSMFDEVKNKYRPINESNSTGFTQNVESIKEEEEDLPF